MTEHNAAPEIPDDLVEAIEFRIKEVVARRGLDCLLTAKMGLARGFACDIVQLTVRHLSEDFEDVKVMTIKDRPRWIPRWLWDRFPTCQIHTYRHHTRTCPHMNPGCDIRSHALWMKGVHLDAVEVKGGYE